MPGIDALRAVAVMAVFLYHANVTWIPGGFLGVDVFFVISGYLITSLLLDEFRRNGHVDVVRFWVRRALRLLPAVGVMIAVTFLAAAILTPDGLLGLRGDAVASLFYVNNWHLILSDQSYFQEFARPSLFRHLWSLAVEEQFYLFWPLLFAAGMTLFGGRRLLYGVIAGILLSTLLMGLLFHPGSDPIRAYYGTDTRAAPLLVGVALALVWSPWALSGRTGRWAPVALDVGGSFALLMVILDFTNVQEFDTGLYRGGFLLLALWTGLLVAALAHPAARIGRVLGIKPMLWLGLRSYSFYLWHWPVLMLTRPGVDVPIHGTVLTLLQLGFVLVLSDLSYRYVEDPFRRRGTVPSLPGGLRFTRPALAAAVVGTVVLVGWSGIFGSGGPSRLETEVARAEARAQQIEAAQGTDVRPGILAIGDSVMVGAAPELQKRFGPAITISADIGRQQADVLALIQGYQAAGELPAVVIIQMGNNGPLIEDEMDEIRDALSDVSHIFLVSDEVPRSWEQESNETILNAAASWPRTELIDWNTLANSRGDLTFDGIHLTPEGVDAYTDLIVDAVRSEVDPELLRMQQ
jgi:peptidoglycan/LPS O-acetylase OafA/YrhL